MAATIAVPLDAFADSANLKALNTTNSSHSIANEEDACTSDAVNSEGIAAAADESVEMEYECLVDNVPTDDAATASIELLNNEWSQQVFGNEQYAHDAHNSSIAIPASVLTVPRTAPTLKGASTVHRQLIVHPHDYKSAQYFAQAARNYAGDFEATHVANANGSTPTNAPNTHTSESPMSHNLNTKLPGNSNGRASANGLYSRGSHSTPHSLPTLPVAAPTMHNVSRTAFYNALQTPSVLSNAQLHSLLMNLQGTNTMNAKSKIPMLADVQSLPRPGYADQWVCELQCSQCGRAFVHSRLLQEWLSSERELRAFIYTYGTALARALATLPTYVSVTAEICVSTLKHLMGAPDWTAMTPDNWDLVQYTIISTCLQGYQCTLHADHTMCTVCLCTVLVAQPEVRDNVSSVRQTRLVRELRHWQTVFADATWSDQYLATASPTLHEPRDESVHHDPNNEDDSVGVIAPDQIHDSDVQEHAYARLTRCIENLIVPRLQCPVNYVSVPIESMDVAKLDVKLPWEAAKTLAPPFTEIPRTSTQHFATVTNTRGGDVCLSTLNTHYLDTLMHWQLYDRTEVHEWLGRWTSNQVRVNAIIRAMRHTSNANVHLAHVAQTTFVPSEASTVTGRTYELSSGTLYWPIYTDSWTTIAEPEFDWTHLAIYKQPPTLQTEWWCESTRTLHAPITWVPTRASAEPADVSPLLPTETEGANAKSKLDIQSLAAQVATNVFIRTLPPLDYVKLSKRIDDTSALTSVFDQYTRTFQLQCAHCRATIALKEHLAHCFALFLPFAAPHATMHTARTQITQLRHHYANLAVYTCESCRTTQCLLCDKVLCSTVAQAQQLDRAQCTCNAFYHVTSERQVQSYDQHLLLPGFHYALAADTEKDLPELYQLIKDCNKQWAQLQWTFLYAKDAIVTEDALWTWINATLETTMRALLNTLLEVNISALDVSNPHSVCPVYTISNFVDFACWHFLSHYYHRLRVTPSILEQS